MKNVSDSQSALLALIFKNIGYSGNALERQNAADLYKNIIITHAD
jgi:hypothetical protein